MMRILDMVYALPILILIIILFALFERNLLLLVVALGSISWLSMARIVRGQVLTLRHEQFIDAARLLGASPAGIVWRHILPNTLGPVIVAATLTIPSVVLGEAFLSFLGLGVQAPLPSLGTLAGDGAQVMALYPPLLLGPAVMLVLSLVSLNLIGDGLRDALDPQSRKL
jgi:oligopeptide transport system permease protein